MHELTKPLQVYVVEDSLIIRRLLGSAIEAADGELIGQSGEAQLALEGFDVLEALGTRARQPLKVVLTNHASEVQAARLRDARERFLRGTSFEP